MSGIGRNMRLIGCNIRPNSVPGGFSHTIANSSRGRPRRKKKVTDDNVKDAAVAALQRRGIHNMPDDFSRTVPPERPALVAAADPSQVAP